MPRRLGQHFLRPPSVLRLLRLIAPAPDEVFLEIGPGQGALTVPLAARCARVVAVEIDETLARRLRERAPSNVEVVVADALAVDLAALVPGGSRLAGNLPYYVSSPLLRRFLALHGHVRDVHVMLQEEVARRIASPPGSKEYGILRALRSRPRPTYPHAFPPGAFAPPPKVNSAILRPVSERSRGRKSGYGGFEAFLQKAFGATSTDPENNSLDSYPYLQNTLVPASGVATGGALSVVEFVAIWNAVKGHRAGAGG
jgi:16S rRNA (adenine1518-N6/adenine1519-N6)-dimethyltransferase